MGSNLVPGVEVQSTKSYQLLLPLRTKEELDIEAADGSMYKNAHMGCECVNMRMRLQRMFYFALSLLVVFAFLLLYGNSTFSIFKIGIWLHNMISIEVDCV
jgi:hypothetical protein